MFMTGISGIIPGVNSVAVGAPSGTDPYWTSTVLLLSGDGSNGSHSFIDESFASHGSGDATGLSNDTQVQTSTKKFGSGSIRFDGGSDVILWNDHNDWSFGNGAFTIEAWVYFDATILASDVGILTHWEATGNKREWALDYLGSGADKLRFACSPDGATGSNLAVDYAWTPTANTWYHIAVDRSGNVFRVYLDGVMVATATNSMTMFNANESLRVGCDGSLFFKGNMDEIRITKGVARYASDLGFSVPTAAYPRS